jgi:hypothetical protein
VNAPFSWVWAAVAVALTAAAVLAGSHYALAVPLAAAAVGGAVIAILDAIRRQPAAGASPSTSASRPTTRVRGWLDAGRMGREDLILLVDRLERKAVNPMLPIRPQRELATLLRLPPEEFRRYLSQRLTVIEAAS